MERDTSIRVLQFECVTSKGMKYTVIKEYYQRIRKILKASLNAGKTILDKPYWL